MRATGLIWWPCLIRLFFVSMWIFFCANLNFKMVSFKLVEKLGGFCHGKSRMTETKETYNDLKFWMYNHIFRLLVLYKHILFSEIKNKFCQIWVKKEEETVLNWLYGLISYQCHSNIFYDLFVIFLKDIST